MQRSLPLTGPTSAPWQRPRDAFAAAARRWREPAARRDLLWDAIWAPFWLWSESPRPELPRRHAPVPAELGLAGEAVVAGIDRVRRRLWVTHGVAAIFRGIGLGVLVASVLMLLDLAGGPIFDPKPALILGGVFLLAGIVLAVLSRPSRQATVRMLDRTFGLQERLATALDDLGLSVPAPGERAPVIYLQMADAANALAALRNDRRLRPAIPVREVVIVVIAALLLTTLAFLRGLGGGLPELAVARVPPFTPAIERPAEPEPSQAEVDAAQSAPTVQQVLERSDRSAQARRDLQALASALADHAATRPAAEQIARGNYKAAGDELRDAADEAGQLSPTARQELGGDLQQAADTMQPKTNGLQEATQSAATGMQKDDQAASAGMRELGDAVERAGQQVVPQGELAAQMRTAQQAAAQRGDNSGDSAASSSQANAADAASQPSASGEPGSGADANSSSGSEGEQQNGSRETSAGNNSGDPRAGQSGQQGQRGQGNAEGAANQPGAGENGRQGQVSQGSESPGMEGDSDAAQAQQGAGAGTGDAEEQGSETASSSSSQLQVGAGEPAAAPDVSNGSGAEANPGELPTAHDQVALPVGSGNEGIQTSPNGGSALRGSGAGVTAGSGYAVQGDVGEAGPDSNRVPPQHRETVERYFSNGTDR